MVAATDIGTADGPREDNVIRMCHVPGLHRDLLVHIASVCPRGGFECGRQTKHTRSRHELRNYTSYVVGTVRHSVSPMLMTACLSRLVSAKFVALNSNGYYLKIRGAQLLNGELG